jgi:RNA polymerase sigma-70 factor (ECF subfamily)
LKDSKEIIQLLKACKQNNQMAQMAIYDRYCKAMYNTAYRIVNNPDDAEDVMQEAFIKAFAKLQSFKAKSTFGAWLKRITVNESLTWLKNNNKYAIDNIEKYPDEIVEEEAIDLHQQSETVQEILQAINRLKTNYKLAITLHLIEGYDYEEIMQIMNVSYDNIRVIMSRAKKNLKQELQKSEIL